MEVAREDLNEYRYIVEKSGISPQPKILIYFIKNYLDKHYFNDPGELEKCLVYIFDSNINILPDYWETWCHARCKFDRIRNEQRAVRNGR